MGKNFFSACNHSQATQASFLTRPTAKDSMYGGAAVSSVLGGMFFKQYVLIYNIRGASLVD